MSNIKNLAEVLADILPAYDSKKWEKVLIENSTIRKGAQVAFPRNKKAGVS